MATQLPKIGERVIEIDARRAGCLTPAFYRFLLDLYEAQAGGADVQAQIRAIALALGSPDGTVANIPDLSFDSFLPKTARVEGNNSIFSQGTLAGGIVSLELENDEFAPLPTSYYGTDALGGKGWHTVFDALAEGVGIVLSADEFGVVGVALAEIPDGGGGVLQKMARDVYGRVTDTSNATTDDLEEGATNLWFTAERAQDAVGAAIAAGAGDGVTLAYNDAGNAINATNTDKGSVAVAEHVADPDPHPQYATTAEALYLVSLRF